jgi:DNA invertase Pin-like site-specific DNA recombinase
VLRRPKIDRFWHDSAITHIRIYAYDGGMKVAIYCRVSTRDKGQDVENQLRQLKDLAKKQGWEIGHQFSDHISGKTSDREQFKNMFSAASNHEFDVLLFWSLDRLSREGALETLQHLQRLTTYGIAYRSYTEPYLDSLGLFRDGVISILACLARQERIRLSERTLSGLERARAQGRVGGRPRIACDRSKVLTLQAAGKSLNTIGRELGLSKTTVHRILMGSR